MIVASLDRKRRGAQFWGEAESRSEAFSIRRLGGSRWCLRRALDMRLAMEFEWSFFRLLFGGEALTQTLPRHRRREVNTTSYLADYLTRSVRRTSGLVLVVYSETISYHPGSWNHLAPSKRTQKFARAQRSCTFLCTCDRPISIVEGRMEFAAPLGAHLAIPGRVSGTPAKSPLDGDARDLRVVSVHPRKI